MDKKTTLSLAAGVLLLILIGAALYFTKPDPVPTPAVETPAYGTVNPLDKKPDLNPVDKTNPFTDVKTNPFE